jgi:hypothetical protein
MLFSYLSNIEDQASSIASLKAMTDYLLQLVGLPVPGWYGPGRRSLAKE